ncbi:hypothetical protein BGZ83_003035 [Gryganskiella cystojenkinii]|nr:hypothetical protein BGZ83_003035 [Gryganskiella cystojenkinii]
MDKLKARLQTLRNDADAANLRMHQAETALATAAKELAFKRKESIQLHNIVDDLETKFKISWTKNGGSPNSATSDERRDLED